MVCLVVASLRVTRAAFALTVALLAIASLESCAESETACEPGSSTECVGPGQCPGTQTCSSDGSRYSTCECGVPLDPSTAVGNCLEAGSFDCDLSNRCCPGSTCVTVVDADGSEFSACAAHCTSGSECESECCAPYDARVRVCSPPRDCQRTTCTTAAECITGCCLDQFCAASAACTLQSLAPSVIGADGAFLGAATSDPAHPDGTCNPSSPFGSSTGASSMFNPNGTYGSATGPLSAYNPSSTTPPLIDRLFPNEPAVRVTKNPGFVTGVDPDDLCLFLASVGL